LGLAVAAAIAFPDGSMTESGLQSEALKGGLSPTTRSRGIAIKRIPVARRSQTRENNMLTRFEVRLALRLCALLTFLPFGPACAQSFEKPIWPTHGWQTSSPEDQGMDSSALARLVTAGVNGSYDSLLIVRHGRLVVEAYYAPYTGDIPHQMFSSTKGVIGTLLGMVYKDGLLDRLDHPVLDFFTDREIANVDEKKKAITIQDLLDMTSGFDWDQGFEGGGKEQSDRDKNDSSNWTQFILDRPMAHPPGEVFYYNNGNPDLVSAIITKLTGRVAEDYARQRLFNPLGIDDWHWDRDPQFLTVGEGMLYLQPRDAAKLGYLYLHHGEWDGRQLLPNGWADVLSHRLVNMHASWDAELSYSNFLWVFPDRRVYMFNGKNGQYIFVFPDQDIVAVTTARKNPSMKGFIDAVAATVKSASALPPNPDAAEQLAIAIKDAATEKPTAIGPTSAIASAVSGKTYKFSEGSLTLYLNGVRPHLEFERYYHDPLIPSVKYNVPIGLDGFYRKGQPMIAGYNAIFPGHNPNEIPVAKGRWADAQTFVIDTQVLGYGEQRRLTLSFDGAKLNLRVAPGVGVGMKLSADGEQSE
jgi:CubicO group peptidase (beta-lactamase class C family)